MTIAGYEGALECVVTARGVLRKRHLSWMSTRNCSILSYIDTPPNTVHAERAAFSACAVSKHLLAAVDVVVIALVDLVFRQGTSNGRQMRSTTTSTWPLIRSAVA